MSLKPDCCKWIALVLVMLAGGCRSPLLGSVPADRLDGVELVDGLVYPSTPGLHGCGAQALASVIAWADPAVDAASLAAELPWHHRGATPVDLLLEARARGYACVVGSGTIEDLQRCVRERTPPIVLIDGSVETAIPAPLAMHWAVVSGVAADGSVVTLAAEHGRHHLLSRSEMVRRWRHSDFCWLRLTARGDATP